MLYQICKNFFLSSAISFIFGPETFFRKRYLERLVILLMKKWEAYDSLWNVGLGKFNYISLGQKQVKLPSFLKKNTI